MNPNNRNLIHTAVYWGSPTPDGYGGFTFDQGVEIDCRWMEKTEKFIDATGEEKVSRAVVRVDQDIDIGGYLFLGDIDDLSVSSAEDDPTDEPQAYRVKAFTKIPSVKGDWYSRKAWL